MAVVVGESARVKERQTRWWSRLLLLVREARRLDCHDHEKFPRSRSTFAPLEKARRSNWVTDRPTLVLLPPPSLPPRFYPTTATALLSRPHSSPLPRLNFRLSYLAHVSFEFPNACIHDFSHFFSFPPSPSSPSQSTKERKEKSREKDLERFLLHVSSRGGHEGVDARLPTSLSLVVATDHRNFKFRNGDENGRESGSIRRERRLFSLGGAVLSVYRSIDTDY